MVYNYIDKHYLQWRSQGYCFKGQVASGKGILGGPPPPPNFSFRMVLNTIGGGGRGVVAPLAPPPTSFRQ